MLTARNLTRLIDGRPIWSDLSLELRDGDRVALQGPTGSGKTLLMRALVGIDALDEGQICFRNRSLDDWSIPEYRRLVRYIPQDASFPTGSVRQSIELFFSFKVHRGLTLDTDELKYFMDILNLPESFLDKTADHLSGGEKQMAALLRSLLLKPEVLLLDEPTSSLDESMVSRVESLMNFWMEGDAGHRFLWTSHDSRQLDRMSERSIHLNGPEKADGPERSSSASVEKPAGR
ncbi:MAG: ATP-binding cassette domain-containing protein [Cyclonatronaceae bacterium]